LILQHILASNPSQSYDRLKVVLSGMGIETSIYESMEIEQLENVVSVLEQRRTKMLKVMPYEREGKDQRYSMTLLEIAATKSLLQEKIQEANERNLIVGMTYYAYVKKISSNRMSGFRTTYLGEGRCAAWSKFSGDVRVLKALEVMKHGSDADFAKLYYIMADGKPNSATRKITLEHITRSSEHSRREMGRYCDSKWEGPWPWEAPVPLKLKRIIEMNNRNRKLLLARKQFNEKLRNVFEGEVERSEVLVGGRDMTAKITGMIHDLGKLSAQLMAEFKDKVRTTFGDDAVKGLNDIYSDKINCAVDTLSDLKSSVEKYLQGLDGSGTGSPQDAQQPGGAVADMGLDLGDDGSDDQADKSSKDDLGLELDDNSGSSLDDFGDLDDFEPQAKERDKKGKK